MREIDVAFIFFLYVILLALSYHITVFQLLCMNNVNSDAKYMFMFMYVGFCSSVQ